MSTGETTTPEPVHPAEAVAAEIRRYGDEFVPGAAEKLGAIWVALGHLPAHQRAEKVAEALAGPVAERYRNPEYAAPKLENGATPSPLRKALSRHAGELRPGAVDQLSREWASDMAGLKPERVAGEVARRLAGRDARDHLANPGPLPDHELRTLDRLGVHFPEMSYTGRARLARDEGRQLSRMPDNQFVMIVARSLTSSVVAAKYSMNPLDRTDNRVHGRSDSIQSRPAPKDDGRGGDKPPPRRSLAF